MNIEKGEHKKFHIVSDAEFGWHNVFCYGFDTYEEAKTFMDSLLHDPYEYLSIVDKGVTND